MVTIFGMMDLCPPQTAGASVQADRAHDKARRVHVLGDTAEMRFALTLHMVRTYSAHHNCQVAPSATEALVREVT